MEAEAPQAEEDEDEVHQQDEGEPEPPAEPPTDRDRGHSLNQFLALRLVYGTASQVDLDPARGSAS
eukprot:4277621-Amphidinium_carterae.1